MWSTHVLHTLLVMSVLWFVLEEPERFRAWSCHCLLSCLEGALQLQRTRCDGFSSLLLAGSTLLRQLQGYKSSEIFARWEIAGHPGASSDTAPNLKGPFHRGCRNCSCSLQVFVHVSETFDLRKPPQFPTIFNMARPARGQSPWTA